jgi:hypothetical protein
MRLRSSAGSGWLHWVEHRERLRFDWCRRGDDVASIDPGELPAAVATLAMWRSADNIEMRAYADAFVRIGEVLIADVDPADALRDFDEVVRVLALPTAERFALLQLRETVNDMNIETEMKGLANGD